MHKADVTPPTGTVTSPGNNQSSTTFDVTVDATDPTSATGDPDEIVSGIAGYNLYDSSNNGSTWTLYNSSPQNSDTFSFIGSPDTLYEFYGRAIDAAGNVQPYSPHVEAMTYVPDTTPPSTAVSGVSQIIDSGTPTDMYTVSFGGADDAGGTGLHSIALYVVEDSGSPRLLTTVYPDTTGDTPSPTYTYTFNAPRDGVSHTFRFYSIGTDNKLRYNGTSLVADPDPNVESAPSPPNDVTITTDFAAPTITGVTVQDGLRERSFIQYVQIGLNDPNLVALLVAHPGRVTVAQYGADGVTVIRSSVANLTLSSTSGGDAILLNFGVGGVGGGRDAGQHDGRRDLPGDARLRRRRGLHRHLGVVLPPARQRHGAGPGRRHVDRREPRHDRDGK